jgi:hypothetical protein
MKTTATTLRSQLYSLLDRVAASGEVIELERRGVRLKIIRDDSSSKLMSLKKRNTMIGGAESLLGLDWSKEWNPDAP